MFPLPSYLNQIYIALVQLWDLVYPTHPQKQNNPPDQDNIVIKMAARIAKVNC